MQELYLGIDICDDYSMISYYSPQTAGTENLKLTDEASSAMIPSVVCKEKGSDTWLIGMEAYSSALYGKGTMVDRLVKLVKKKGTATIEGVKYSADDLMQIFVEKLLDIAMEKLNGDFVASAMFTFQQKDSDLMETIFKVTDKRGISRSRVHMANHSEAYLFYVISQPKSLWNNMSCLFDLTENGLHYYELDVIRGRNPQVVEVRHEELEEGFSLEILETGSGQKLGDTILYSCAERLMRRKVYNSVFLTGKGFEDAGWAKNFGRLVCAKRRVFSGAGLFSCGAAFMAYDAVQENSSYPYICLCEGRLEYSLSLQVLHEGRERQLLLASAGSDWYEAGARAVLIPDGLEQLTFHVTDIGSGEKKRLQIPLTELPERPRKTTKLEVVTGFDNEKHLRIQVTDKGFGELFPGTGLCITREFEI